MSAQHMPPLPWKVNENAEPNQWYITSGDRKWVIGLSMNGEMFPSRQRAVLERMTACVNACEGMADPATEIAELRAALAALVDQCGKISPFQRQGGTVQSVRDAGKFVQAYDAARAAIAKAVQP